MFPTTNTGLTQPFPLFPLFEADGNIIPGSLPLIASSLGLGSSEQSIPRGCLDLVSLCPGKGAAVEMPVLISVLNCWTAAAV